MKYVLGEPKGDINAFWAKQIKVGKEKLEVGPTLLTSKEEGEEEWDWGTQQGSSGALDGRIGYREWSSLAAVFERALMFLPRVSECDCGQQLTALVLNLLSFRCRGYGCST